MLIHCFSIHILCLGLDLVFLGWMATALEITIQLSFLTSFFSLCYPFWGIRALIVQALQTSFCIFLRLSPDWPQASFIILKKKKNSPDVQHEIITRWSHSEHYLSLQQLYWLLHLEQFEFPTSSVVWYLASFRQDTFSWSEPTGYWAGSSWVPRPCLKEFSVSVRSLLQSLVGMQQRMLEHCRIGECNTFIFSAGALNGIQTSGAHDSFTALWLRLFVPILEKHRSPAHIVLHWFVWTSFCFLNGQLLGNKKERKWQEPLFPEGWLHPRALWDVSS